MKNLSTSLLALLIVLFNFSCSNDDDETDDNPSNTNEFIAPTKVSGNVGAQIQGTWEVISITENGVLEQRNECDLRETVTYGSSNDYLSIEAETDNEPCRFFNNRGSYSLNGTTINFNLGGDRFNQTIVGLNDTGLVLKEVYNDNGKSIVFVETYRRVNSLDNKSNISASNLVGQWEIVSRSVGGQQQELFCENSDEFVFEGDGSNNSPAIRIEFNDRETGDCIETDRANAAWSLSGNQLSYSEEGADSDLSTIVYTILELNDTTLKWSIELGGSEGVLIATYTRK